MSLKKKNDVLNQIIIWTCAGFWNYDFRKLRTTNNSNKLAKINESKITNSVKITSKKFRKIPQFDENSFDESGVEIKWRNCHVIFHVCILNLYSRSNVSESQIQSRAFIILILITWLPRFILTPFLIHSRTERSIQQ